MRDDLFGTQLITHSAKNSLDKFYSVVFFIIFLHLLREQRDLSYSGTDTATISLSQLYFVSLSTFYSLKIASCAESSEKMNHKNKKKIVDEGRGWSELSYHRQI